MKWAAFKGQTVVELIATVDKWKRGEDASGATEFAIDVLDNGVFRFAEGSLPERASDTVLAFLGPELMPKLGANLAHLAASALDARPLSHLPG